MKRFAYVAQSVAVAMAFVAAVTGVARAAQVGQPAPAFSVARPGGGTVSLAAFKGKPVYINFYAWWCPPCNDEAPTVAALYAKYKSKGLVIIGMDDMESKDRATAFAKKYHWTFPLGLDSDGAVGRAYGNVIGLPVHVFIDRSGKISTYRPGIMQPGEIADAIEQIVR